MMRLLGAHSIRHKLMAGVLLTTVSALLILGTSVVVYDLRDYHERLLNDLTTQAQLIGSASAPALQFGDPQLAGDYLGLLRFRPQIRAAAIYDAKGALFANYVSKVAEQRDFPPLPDVDGEQVSGTTLTLFKRIIHNNEILGTLYLRAHYQLYDRLWQYAGIVLAVTLLALVISMLLSLWLQSRITRPILAVTGLARQVAERRDYSLRAEKSTDDEVGYLVEAFNELLSEVGRRSAELESSNSKLQQQIRERREVDRALHDSERRHRTLVTALTSVVWIADANGDFGPEQESWDSYTGQEPATHRGRGWLDAFHEGDRKLVAEAWEQAHTQRKPLELEVRLWHEDTATYRYVFLRAVPLLDAQGKLIEWIGTAEDIDERRRAAREIRRLNAELEQRVSERTAELKRAVKELQAFSYSVSHDLRTPLRAIDGFSLALVEDYGDQLDDTARDYIDRVRSGAQRMGQLIDDLLKLSRVSRADLSCESLDLSEMAESIVAAMRDNDPEREVEVRITSGLSAYGDARLMRIALENLLNNAWKYSGKAEQAVIEFGMRSYKGEPCYFVQDNGVGFDMAYVDKLFNAFQRLHDGSEFPGTGIGLATVQRIISRHGGRVWAEGSVGGGAVFYFTLPGQPGAKT